MEDTINISPHITIGPQLDADGWEMLAQQGYRTVVNLSTKGELGQTRPEQEGQAVTEHGMRYVHFPVSVSRLNQKHVEEFLHEVRGVPTPAYVHCRLGQRAGPFALIWTAVRRNLTIPRVKQRARELGLFWASPFLGDFIRRSLLRLREQRHCAGASARPA